MAETLPPQPTSDNPMPWPASADLLAMQAAIAGDPGPLTYPDPPAVYSADQNDPSRDYTYYKIQHIYADDSGMEVLKTGNADQTTQSYHTVVQMHNPFTELRVVWTAQRWGQKPKIPSKDLNNRNFVYIRGVRSPMNALQFPNGLLYRVSGIFLYQTLQAMTEADNYPTGVTPAETGKTTDPARVYTSDDISPSILDASIAVPPNNSLPQTIVESVPTPPLVLPAPIYVPPR
jgi:hypothetical protein